MAYIGTSPSNGVRRVLTYTATANQTTFTGTSSEGITLTYSDGNYVDVFQNGVLLGTADYTATSGTSIVLVQGASVNDIIVIIVYDVFSVADTVSQSAGGTFEGNVTMAGTLGVTGAVTLSTALPVASGGTGLTSIAHTVQVFTSGSGTYTTPSNVKAIWVRCAAGGGGGASNGASGQNAGSGGGNTTFGTLTASGGGSSFYTAAGGVSSGGDINSVGGATGVGGNSSPSVTQGYGGPGGSCVLGGGGSGGSNGGQAGNTPGAGYGGGGGGCGTSSSYIAMAGGGGGGYTEKLINSPSSTYSYAVGAGGAGGTGGGSGGGVGGAGAGGVIIVTEYYV